MSKLIEQATQFDRQKCAGSRLEVSSSVAYNVLVKIWK
jgi:urease beta subunit